MTSGLSLRLLITVYQHCSMPYQEQEKLKADHPLKSPQAKPVRQKVAKIIKCSFGFAAGNRYQHLHSEECFTIRESLVGMKINLTENHLLQEHNLTATVFFLRHFLSANEIRRRNVWCCWCFRVLNSEQKHFNMKIYLRQRELKQCFVWPF